MDKEQLYDALAQRKHKPKDLQPYAGDNGRVNRCAKLIREGTLRSNVLGALLDVGGGIGDLGYAVRDFFDKRVVLDISTKNLEAARAKGNLTVRDDVDRNGINLRSEFARFGTEDQWKWAEAGNNVIDLITALDFIEHIIDPETFARECFVQLKSGGHVFINTPNIQYWRHLDELVRKGKFPHTSGDREVYHGGHLAFFTFNDLCEIFSHAGFISCEQIMDDEGFETPPDFWLKTQVISSQNDYIIACKRMGNPNLLFKCVKP